MCNVSNWNDEEEELLVNVRTVCFAKLTNTILQSSSPLSSYRDLLAIFNPVLDKFTKFLSHRNNVIHNFVYSTYNDELRVKGNILVLRSPRIAFMFLFQSSFYAMFPKKA